MNLICGFGSSIFYSFQFILLENLSLFFDHLSGFLRERFGKSTVFSKRSRRVVEAYAKKSKKLPDKSGHFRTSSDKAGHFPAKPCMFLKPAIDSQYKPIKLNNMATITKGILGGFSGTVGTIVGATWRGKDIIRSRPKPSGKQPTEKQKLQQAKFGLAINFLQPLRTLQNLYFGNKAGVKSRVNQAVSYLINNAMEVVENLPKLVYNKVLITKGDLTGFQNVAVVVQPDQVMKFSWENNVEQGNAAADDVFCAVCYCEELNDFSITDNGIRRDALLAEVQLPEYLQGKQVRVFVFFHNQKETGACNSVYLGAQEVQ